jgi:hypothetical protein
MVLNEPLGTLLILALAVLWLVVGGYFIATRRGQRSRLWLGVALVLAGLGAVQAGVSFQAFSYELKCAGRETCLYTNGFEVGYSVTQAWSVSAMVAAVAFACAQSRLRRGLIVYAVANSAVYCVVTVIGVMQPNRFLLSFEVLMLFALPGIIAVIVVSRRRRSAVEARILAAALLLVGVNVAYFAYYAAGVTEALWDGGEGFYFSANDVLHIGLIGWLLYVWIALGPILRDLRVPDAQAPSR